MLTEAEAYETIDALGACWVDEWPDMAQTALELLEDEPLEAWPWLIKHRPEDAWWLIQRLDKPLYERLVEPWRRALLRCGAWRMLSVRGGQAAAELLTSAADAPCFDKGACLDAASAAFARAQEVAHSIASFPAEAATARAANEVNELLLLLDEVTDPAGEVASFVDHRDDMRVILRQSEDELLAVAPTVVDAWEKFIRDPS